MFWDRLLRRLRTASSRLASFQALLLLTVIYILTFPLLTFLRLRDPLGRSPRGRDSFWHPREHTLETAESLRRLF
jgi:hypothetical protein